MSILGVLAIILCLFSLSFHELGHAYAMLQCKVKIKKINLLGFPVSFLPSLVITVQTKWQEDPIPCLINPLILGASVEADMESFGKISPRDRAYIYGAGPLASFLYAFGMWILASLTMMIENGHAIFYLTTMGIMLLICGVLWLFKRFMSRYVLPCLGIAALVGICMMFWNDHEVAINSVGGPVAIVRDSNAVYEGMLPHARLATPFYLAGFLSFVLGLTNLLPFVPFDGGQVIRVFVTQINERVGKYYTYITGCLFLLLIIASFAGDIRYLVSLAIKALT